MVDLNYSIRGANNDTITFDSSNYVLNPEFGGFYIPPTQVRIDERAGNGGVFRHTKKGVRDLDLSVTVLGSSRSEVQTKLRRLSRLVQNDQGATTFRASYDSGENLSLQVYYTGGAEGQWGSDAGLIWSRIVLSFQAPQPFWESETTAQFTVTTGGVGRGLLPELTKMKLSSSNNLGNIEVENNGDVIVYPNYVITGPIANFVSSNNGQSFGFTELLAEGETLFIDSENATVVNQAGVNRYSILDPAPKFFALGVGESIITIDGTDTGATTRVDVFYQLKYEVVH